MTKQEYKAFEQSFNEFMDREGINCLSTVDGECRDCGEDQGEYSEPSFSWSSCDCCGSSLGGDRYHVAGYNKEHDAIFCYDVCPDCLYYSAYGQLDDQTMLDMEGDN